MVRQSNDRLLRFTETVSFLKMKPEPLSKDGVELSSEIRSLPSSPRYPKSQNHFPFARLRLILIPSHRTRSNVAETTISTGPFKGDVLTPSIPVIPTDMPFQFKRLQFPVRNGFRHEWEVAIGENPVYPTTAVSRLLPLVR
jgi:ATP-dependent DNA helicase PIF1